MWGTLVPPYPHVPWELSLAQHGRARRQDFWEHMAQGGHNTHTPPAPRSMGLTLPGARMVTARNCPPSCSPKEMGLGRHPQSPGRSAWTAWWCPCCVPRGRGRGEQPNAFQKISCKWPGRVIHIKLIKPLLVSQGRNPDVAVYLFWISPFSFFFFSFPFNIFFQEIFKGTGTPRHARQQGSAGAGCPWDVWSWRVGASHGALASQRVGQISRVQLRGHSRGGGRSWHCWTCHPAPRAFWSPAALSWVLQPRCPQGPPCAQPLSGPSTPHLGSLALQRGDDPRASRGGQQRASEDFGSTLARMAELSLQ